MYNIISSIAIGRKERIIADRRYLHENAECGFRLTKTVEYIKRRLSECGCKYTDIGKSGVLATVNPGCDTAVLLRADTDALPISEETALPFASDNGNMHACGHDMHTAMLLGCAEILKELESKLDLTVKLLFQPAEELLAGAHDCLNAGILDDKSIKHAFAIHVLTDTTKPTGSIIVSSGGRCTPFADFFELIISGESAHAAMPDKGVDAVRISGKILSKLYKLQDGKSSLITVGSIHGGTAANIIADSVKITGSIRAKDESIRARIKERLSEICRSVNEKEGMSVVLNYTGGCPALINDALLADKFSGYAEHYFNVVRMNKIHLENRAAMSGSEDFAAFAERIPSLMVSLCAGERSHGYDVPIHNPRTVFDEDALFFGTVMYALFPFII